MVCAEFSVSQEFPLPLSGIGASHSVVAYRESLVTLREKAVTSESTRTH